MRYGWVVLVLGMVLAVEATAQITKTATFDNYTAGQSLIPSFTDPLSGITFSYSTLGTGFVIDGDPLDLYDGSNYLTAGGGPNDGQGANFGFIGTLHAPANYVALEAFAANVTLEGFDSTGTLVAEQTGPVSSPIGSSNLQISSSQYNITSFQVMVTPGGFEGYDNISYTYLPEPTLLPCLLGIVALRLRRKSQPRSLIPQSIS
ncbi:MAG TPA: hypothetical protein VGG19_06460 [Tepidisphaeraceae bacterium]|jgi:hypothetical protein